MRERDVERCELHDRIIAQQADLAAATDEVRVLSEAVEAANVVIQVNSALHRPALCKGWGDAGARHKGMRRAVEGAQHAPAACSV